MDQDRADHENRSGGGSGRGRSSAGSGKAGKSGGGRSPQNRSGGRGRAGSDGSGTRRSGSGRAGGSGSSQQRSRAGASEGGRSKAGRAGYAKKSNDRGSRSERAKGDADRGTGRARRDLKGAAVDLPFWVVEDLTRVTPKERVSAALAELGNATNALIEGRYKVALRSARRAKDLAPRDATVRETLGLAAYRAGDWLTALTELRVYRRLAGESTHMPIEMDSLRALGRGPDVVKAWQELQRIGAAPAVHKEGLVVYASFLIDEGEIEEARRLATPRKLKPNPYPADLRVWYVGARANALAGDVAAARKIRDAINLADPAFPGMDELETAIARSMP